MTARVPPLDLQQVTPRVFWTDRPDRPSARPALQGSVEADLVIVGAGYSGLWAALQAADEAPGRSIVVLEAEVCGDGASSRNGGFCNSSLTHGVEQGASLWPNEIQGIVGLGRQNFDQMMADIDRYDIDCGAYLCAALDGATEEWQMEELHASIEIQQAVGNDVEMHDEDEMRRRLNSPTFIGGRSRYNHHALVDPARLVWGLAAAAERVGVRLFDRSPVIGVEETSSHTSGRTMVVSIDGGTVHADRVIVATNAYRGPVRRMRRYMIPVYDHVLMTEPLTSEQMASIGWAGREGAGDSASQFHYTRLTEDNRILWGGYDATYHFNNGIDPAFELSEGTHQKIAGHFYAMFPQLEDVRFTHRWGGPIATTSRFTATWGTSHGGRLSWVAGYTGLGVAASRFGARVALDLVDGLETERTELEMVRRHPFPFPPEPMRSAAVGLTKRAIQRSDERDGKRGAWLGLLDRFGIGFDS